MVSDEQFNFLFKSNQQLYYPGNNQCAGIQEYHSGKNYKDQIVSSSYLPKAAFEYRFPTHSLGCFTPICVSVNKLKIVLAKFNSSLTFALIHN